MWQPCFQVSLWVLQMRKLSWERVNNLTRVTQPVRGGFGHSQSDSEPKLCTVRPHCFYWKCLIVPHLPDTPLLLSLQCQILNFKFHLTQNAFFDLTKSSWPFPFSFHSPHSRTLPSPLLKLYLTEKNLGSLKCVSTLRLWKIHQGLLGRWRSASSVPPEPGTDPSTEEQLGDDGWEELKWIRTLRGLDPVLSQDPSSSDLHEWVHDLAFDSKPLPVLGGRKHSGAERTEAGWRGITREWQPRLLRSYQND